MAQVDFSHAKLEAHDAVRPYRNVNLSLTGVRFVDIPDDFSQHDVASSLNISILENTPTKKSFVYTGAFSDSGTSFYINVGNTRFSSWKVSNISFNSGDTFSFKITVNVTTP